MRHLYRGGLFALLVTMTAALAAGPATADTAEAFQGTAAAQALHISVLGKDATFGVADVNGASTLKAVASAAGQLLAQATSSSASVSKDDTSVADPTSGLRCGAGQLPAPLDTVLSLNLVCSSVKADIVKGAPHAFGQGSVATIGLNANTVLKQLNDTLHVGQTLSDTLQPVVKAVNDATGGSLNIDPASTLQQVIDGLLTTQTLAVKLGVSNSELTTVAGNLTSTSRAQGGEIDILPVAVLGEPLATITVGSAQTRAAYDRVKGLATATADPSLVKVHFAPTLGLPEVNVAPGQTVTILQGTPLESTIIVADGSTDISGSSAKAVADGVSLQLFKGLNLGSGTAAAAATPEAAVVLQLAHSESSVSGAPAVVSPVPPAAPAPPAPQVKALALTGPSPWLGVMGIVLLGSAYGARRLSRRYS
jgi:hypothetical protein